MPEFDTLSAKKVDFNNGGEFFELTVGVVRDKDRENKYLRVSRGFYDQEGEPKYKRGGLTLPINKEAINELADALKEWDISELEAERGDAKF